MRILFLSYAESHSTKWVNALSEKGHEIIFVMQKNRINHIENLDSRINVVELPVKGRAGYYLNAFYLRKIEQKYKPDISNIHFASGYGTMARLAGLKNVVLSVWGSDVYDFPYKNRFCFSLLKKNLLYAKVIASTSECMARQVRTLIGDQKKIIVTPFGVDIRKFSREGCIKKSNNITIGNIKVLSAKYGIDNLIEAFALLKKELLSNSETIEIGNRLKCKIYGDGDQKVALNNLIHKLEMDDEINLCGEISHNRVPEALSEIDIFCATSVMDSESFGVAVVEAEAMEIPVVVSDVDGFKEVVENGVTGFIVERRNIGEIKNALKELVLNPNLRYEMGKNGRARVLKLYDFEKNVKQMEKAYEIAVKE